MTSTPESRIPAIARLRAFDAVAGSGSMSQAAELLHVTQPAVTRAIAALETDLGARLLERGQGGSALTAQGATLARRTGRFLRQLSAAVAEAAGREAGDESVPRIVRKLGDPHIRALLAVWRAGNFRKGAALLGLREPTLHRPARALERLLQVPLYRRAATGQELTRTGMELARRWAVAAVEIATAMDELGAPASDAVITIGVLALAPKRLLATAAEELVRRHKRTRVVIEEGSYETLVAALRSGAIDLIFGALRSPLPHDDLAERPFFGDPYIIACRRGHPLTVQSQPQRALGDYGWVFPTARLPRRAVLDRIVTAWDLSARVEIETNMLDTTIAALVAGDRLGLLPRECVDDNPGTLAALDIPVPQPARRVGITTRLDWLPTAAQAELIPLLGGSAA